MKMHDQMQSFDWLLHLRSTIALRLMKNRTITVFIYINNSVEYSGTWGEWTTLPWPLSIVPYILCYFLPGQVAPVEWLVGKKYVTTDLGVWRLLQDQKTTTVSRVECNFSISSSLTPKPLQECIAPVSWMWMIHNLGWLFEGRCIIGTKLTRWWPILLFLDVVMMIDKSQPMQDAQA